MGNEIVEVKSREQTEQKEEDESFIRTQIGILRISGYSKDDASQILKAKKFTSDDDRLEYLLDEIFSIRFDILLSEINYGISSLPEIELFADDKEDAHARFTYRGNPVIEKIRSGKFNNYLYKTLGPIKKNKFDPMVNSIAAEAIYNRPQYKLNYRIARVGNTLYYDLGKHGIVRIDKKGWRILNDESPIIFRKSPLFQDQSIPAEGATTDLLFKYINIKGKDDQLLTISFIVASLVGEIPKPILALSGSQGSAKTTTQKILTEIVDPSLSQDSHLRDIRELLQEASQRYVLPFDNLSYINEADSDLLCKMVTGTTFSKRRLYTDEDSILFRPHCTIILNGINLPVNRSDLLSRCLIINLPRIDEKTRCDEASLLQDFERDKPGILGAFFSLLSKAFSLYDDVKIDKLPRMADFAKWACATFKALGLSEHDFINAYEKNLKIQNEEAVYSSALGQVLIDLFGDKDQIKGTPTTLLKTVREYARDNGMDLRHIPATPHAMGKELKRITPNLEPLGFTIDYHRGKQRQYVISRRQINEEQTTDTSSSDDSSKPNDDNDVCDVSSEYYTAKIKKVFNHEDSLLY